MPEPRPHALDHRPPDPFVSRLRALIIEAHRRSIWQVLGVYLVGSWLGYQVILALTEGLGLPHWVPPFAVVLFIIGLPIVLATAVVQEGPPVRPTAPRDPTLLPGIERLDGTLLDDSDSAAVGPADSGGPRRGGAARLFTWRRALGGGAVAFLVLGLSAAGYLGMRAAGIGPAGTLLSRGELSDADRLVLADFGATGTDTLLAIAITDALRIDFEQSRAVSLASTSFLQGAQQRMGRAQGARLPEADALQLAVREGLKAVITGDIARVGAAFTVNARVLRASDGEPLISVREQARSEAELLDAVDRVSRRVRERIGESLRTVHASEPLAQVTTGSIEALQLYSQAARLHLAGSSDDADRAVHLAEQAIAIDPGFAMAYRLLGVISSNAQFDRGRARAMLSRAHELGGRLTERERLATTAAYHRETGDTDRAVAAYEQLLSRHPDDLSALNNVAILYGERGDMARAVELYARIVEEDSTRRLSHTNLVYELAGSGRIDEAQAALELTRRRFPDDPAFDRAQAAIHTAGGKLADARRSSEAFVASSRAPLARAFGMGNLAVLDALGGRPGRALTHHRAMTGLLQQAGAGAGALMVRSRFSLVRIESWGEPAARVLAELEEYLAQHALDAMPLAERPYAALAVTFAAAGHAGRARELRDRFQRDVVAAAGLRSDELELQVLDGQLLVYEGRAAEGARLLRDARERMGCSRCLVPKIAWAFDRAAIPDSALAYYDLYLDTPMVLGPVDVRWRTRAMLRAAELHEASGNLERARLHYARLLELWDDAESSMQPQVQAVRTTLTRLMAERQP
jgi:eukaryotic-like serine/threonine-protein kinase